MVAVHIYAPRSFIARTIQRCFNCEKNRRVVAWLYEWHDPMFRCCACGDGWGGGERAERPFERGWRKKEIARAKAAWATGKTWKEAAADLWEHIKPHLEARS